MNRLIIAGIGVLAAAMLSTGCGGGGNEAAAQVSKGEFFKRARAVCAKTQKKLRAEFTAAKSASAAYGKIAPLLEREGEELDALSGPEAVEERVKPLVANILGASRLVAQRGKAGAEDPSIQAYKKEASELHLEEC